MTAGGLRGGPETARRWTSIAWIIGPPLAIVILAVIIIRPSFGTSGDASAPTGTAAAVNALPTAFPSVPFEPVDVASLQITSAPFENGASVYDLALAGERVVAGGAVGDDPAIWYSDDRGQTWSKASLTSLNPPDPRAQARIEALAVHQGRIAALGHWYLGRSGSPITQSIWISDDAGASWTEKAIAVPRQLVLSLLAGGDLGFVAATLGAGPVFYRSDDAVTWEVLHGDPSLRYARIVRMYAYQDSLTVIGMIEGLTDESVAALHTWQFTDAKGWQPQALSVGQAGFLDDVVQDASGIYLSGTLLTTPDPQHFDESLATVWQSEDGVHWDRRSLSDAVGLQAGRLAHGPLGLVVTGGATNAFAGRRDRDRPNFVWFIPNGATSAAAQEYHVPWFGSASIGLPDRFLVFGRCATDADGCRGSVLVTITGSDGDYRAPRPR